MNKNYLLNLENDTNISIRLPKELRDLFNKHCKSNMLNSSAVIRMLMIDFLEENKK